MSFNPSLYGEKYRNVKIHPTAIIDSDVEIGPGVQIWAWTHVRQGAKIGAGTIIGERVSIGPKVSIGSGCKIQNNADIHEGVTIGNDVFIGPGVRTTNDPYPRAVGDWADRFQTTQIDDRVAIGAGATILCGITLGAGCMVGAGSVVTKCVAPSWLVAGNPAKRMRAIE